MTFTEVVFGWGIIIGMVVMYFAISVMAMKKKIQPVAMAKACGSKTCDRVFTTTVPERLYCSLPCKKNEKERRKKRRRQEARHGQPLP